MHSPPLLWYIVLIIANAYAAVPGITDSLFRNNTLGYRAVKALDNIQNLE